MYTASVMMGREKEPTRRDATAIQGQLSAMTEDRHRGWRRKDWVVAEKELGSIQNLDQCEDEVDLVAGKERIVRYVGVSEVVSKTIH